MQGNSRTINHTRLDLHVSNPFKMNRLGKKRNVHLFCCYFLSSILEMGDNSHNDSANGNKYECILHSVVLYSE